MRYSDQYQELEKSINIAYFISPHGFGHAARAAAVMETLQNINPIINFEIFTTVPNWFFIDSLPGNYKYHKLITDIGLVQKNPLTADIHETVNRLDLFLPFDDSLISNVAETLANRNCKIVLCDIAPIGIMIARKAGISSILIENFTWDWLYEYYLKTDKRIFKHIDYLRKIFNSVDFHIQTKPICNPLDVDLTTLPVSRKCKNPASVIRKQLEIPENMKILMITMGGIQEEITFLKKFSDFKDIYFIIPGSIKKPEKTNNWLLLPHRSDFYHPDLINACDAVVGKVGYSTLSEVYYADIPFGYIARDNFRESKYLIAYIKKHIPGINIKEKDFYSGNWLSRIPELFSMSKVKRNHLQTGSNQVARFVNNLLG